MTKANRKALPATRVALLLFAAAGLLPATPAMAQLLPPEDVAASGAPPASNEPPALSQPPTPTRRPAMTLPYGYPYARPQTVQQQKPPLTEPEGPVTSWAPLRFGVALEGRTTWPINNAAKRLVGSQTRTGAGLTLQGDVYRQGDKLAVRLDLAWVNTTTTSLQDSSGLSERFENNLFSLGVSARYHIFRWLAPFVRLTGGGGWDKLTVSDLHDRQSFSEGSLGGGFFLRTPGLRLWQGDSAPFLGLVGNLEGGYALATSSDFSLHSSPASTSTTPIPTSPVPIGTVGRSAPYVRFSLGIAF